IAKRNGSEVDSVTKVLSPFGSRSTGAWRSQDETIDVVRQSCEIKTEQTSIGCQDDSGSFFVRFAAKRVADVWPQEGCEVRCGGATGVARAEQDLRRGQFARGEGKLEVDVVGAAPVWHSTALGLGYFPGKFSVVVLSPQSHGKADLLEVVHATDPLRFHFCTAQ